MTQRTNAGYTITDSLTIGNTEFVIGKNNATPPMFVTWACKGGNDYFWGHYMASQVASSSFADLKESLLSQFSES